MSTTTLDFPLVTLLPGEDAHLALAVEAGVYAATLPERRELRAIVAAGDEARERLWWAGVRTAASLAYRHAARSGLPVDDVLQDACVAVSEAVCTWDCRRGASFTTHVYHLVSFAMQSVGRHRGGSWSSSKGDRRAARVVADEHSRLAERGIRLAPHEIAALTGVSATAAARGATMIVGLPDEQLADPDAAFAFHRIDELGTDFLELLHPRHRTMLKLRFGLDGPAHTLQEAAAVLGISSSTALRVHQGALRAARRILEEERTTALRSRGASLDDEGCA